MSKSWDTQYLSSDIICLLFLLAKRTNSVNTFRRLISDTSLLTKTNRNLKEIPIEVDTFAGLMLRSLINDFSTWPFIPPDAFSHIRDAICLRSFEIFSEVFQKFKKIRLELILIPFWAFSHESSTNIEENLRKIPATLHEFESSLQSLEIDEIMNAALWLETFTNSLSSRRSRRPSGRLSGNMLYDLRNLLRSKVEVIKHEDNLMRSFVYCFNEVEFLLSCSKRYLK